jgi:hypothetical protein
MFILPTQVSYSGRAVLPLYCWSTLCSFWMMKVNMCLITYLAGRYSRYPSPARRRYSLQASSLPLSNGLTLLSASTGPVAEDIANFLHAVPDIITAIELLTYA